MVFKSCLEGKMKFPGAAINCFEPQYSSCSLFIVLKQKYWQKHVMWLFIMWCGFVIRKFMWCNRIKITCKWLRILKSSSNIICRGFFNWNTIVFRNYESCVSLSRGKIKSYIVKDGLKQAGGWSRVKECASVRFKWNYIR